FGAALLALVGAGCGGSSDDEASVADSTTTTTTTPPQEGAVDGVPAIDCAELLNNDDIELALGIDERPDDERDSLGFAQNEVCSETLVVDESVFVRVEPGEPDDFASASGDPVRGVGDEAVWSGADDEGTLAVRQATELGTLYYRIVLGRPDLADDEQRDIATEVAQNALSRFPGVTQEPTEVMIEHDEIDRSNESFADNLLAKEQAGEWTRGEGLAATLGAFAGEVDTADVLASEDLVDQSGTAVIALAREHLAEEDDAEISRLLEHVVVSDARLEAMTGGAPPTVINVRLAQTPDDCATYWGATEPCMAKMVSPELDELFGIDKYTLYGPAQNTEDTKGWSEDHIAWAMQAMVESAKSYENLGAMPEVVIMLTPFTSAYSHVDASSTSCSVNLNTPMQGLSEGYFKQWVANEMAHCLISREFAPQVGPGYPTIRWWKDGLAVWLSTVVYSPTNFEWVSLPQQLQRVELSTTLLDRGYTNWLFFEHAGRDLGTTGTLEIIRALPTSGGPAQQADALAAFPGIHPLLHAFVQDLSDADVADGGGGEVPYVPPKEPVSVSGPTIIFDNPLRFGTIRWHVVVDPGQTACIDFDADNGARASWRPGDVAEPGSWSDDLPSRLEDEAVVAVTATQNGATFTMNVTDVSDDPDCEEDEDPGIRNPCRIECESSRYYIVSETG
ncbi:MAG: hypothetical protein ABWZ15_11400, partial [Acidimicrobiia bacterium]